MADIIQQRRDTAARWAQYNPILLEGEVGYVTDNPNQYKIGNGRDKWNDLPLRGYTGTITQDTGDDENAVMSQKSVTDKLSELGSVIEYTVDTLASLKEKKNLNIGYIVSTRGYNFIDDGGGAKYRVSNDVPNGYTIISLSDGLSATMINPFNVYNIASLGYVEGSDFGKLYSSVESILPEGSTLVDKGLVTLDSPMLITKRMNIDFNDIQYRNYSDGCIVLGSAEKSANYSTIRFRLMFTEFNNYTSLSNFGLKFVNASFCNIYFDTIQKLGFAIYIKPSGSCGQNIFRWNMIKQGNQGVVFSGESSWDRAYWAEGNVFQFGFINSFNRGVYFTNNIKSNAALFIGAIDCLDIPDSWDIIDNSNTTDYSTGNLYVLNFVRLPRWQNFKIRDTLLQPSTGLQTAGDITSQGNMSCKSATIADGYIALADTLQNMPRFDFYNTKGGIRQGRIMMQNGIMRLSSINGISLNGIGSVEVEKGSYTINISYAAPNDNYMVIVTPSWLTNVAVTNKTKDGFTLEYNAPSSNQILDYQILFL